MTYKEVTGEQRKTEYQQQEVTFLYHFMLLKNNKKFFSGTDVISGSFSSGEELVSNFHVMEVETEAQRGAWSPQAEPEPQTLRPTTEEQDRSFSISMVSPIGPHRRATHWLGPPRMWPCDLRGCGISHGC